VLALPYAIHLTGWLGLILLVVMGVTMQYTALMFGRNRRKFMLETFSDNIEVGTRIVCLMSYVMCHMSYVVCRMSYAVCLTDYRFYTPSTHPLLYSLLSALISLLYTLYTLYTPVRLLNPRKSHDLHSLLLLPPPQHLPLRPTALQRPIITDGHTHSVRYGPRNSILRTHSTLPLISWISNH
jgi:hypothetical protein